MTTLRSSATLGFTARTCKHAAASKFFSYLNLSKLKTDKPLPTAEKNLRALKTIMTRLPSTTRLAFVGDGPERDALQQHFADMPNVKFMVSIIAPSGDSDISLHLEVTSMLHQIAVLCIWAKVCLWFTHSISIAVALKLVHAALSSAGTKGRHAVCRDR